MAQKSVKVVILGDAKSAAEAFREVSSAAENSQSKLASIGAKMKSVGATMTKSVTLPLLALGGAAVAAAIQYDEASDTIRAGTGATGKELDALNESFKRVFTTVPASAADTAKAISDLNTRTGATGERLEGLATQVLHLSRLTGEDLGQVIASTTRVFGDWNIATEDQARTLDYIWKVSQNTGIGISQLSDKVVQFGAPLRQLGFDFESAAAMMGKWEQEGVNLELVLGGMKRALGKFAKAGEDPVKALQAISDQILNAGTQAEASQIAIEAFGQRAGPDMASAIREGRFDLEELISTLAESDETIVKASDDTMSFNEKLVLLKNKAIDAAIPIGEKLLAAIDNLMPSIEKVIGWVAGAVEWFSKLPEPVQTAGAAIALLAIAAGPLLSALGSILPLLEPLTGLLGGLSKAAGLSGAASSIGLLTTSLTVLAGVAVGIGLAVLIKDLWEGKRAADGLHESVKTLADGYAPLTEAQERRAGASLIEAQTQVKLRESVDGVIRSTKEQALMAEEVAQAWALSGAKTKAEMDAVAQNVLDNYDSMQSKTAEALYSGSGIVPTNYAAWNQASIDVGVKLDEAKSKAQEKFDLIHGIVDKKGESIKTVNYATWNQMSIDIGVKLDEAKSKADEKFDLIKKSAEGVPAAISASLSALPAAIESAFKGGYQLAVYWANRIASLNVKPNTTAGARAAFAMAEGAFVRSTPGGVPLIVAEGGENEWVIPESKLKRMLLSASAPVQSSRASGITIESIIINGARREGEEAADAFLGRLAALGATR